MTPFRSLACLALALTVPACAQDVVRHKYPGSDFPIAMAVEVPAGKKLVFVSGSGPSVADKAAKPGTFAAYGDTATQTVSVLESIQANLKTLNLSMKDVVKMQVFLVGDPAQGKDDAPSWEWLAATGVVWSETPCGSAPTC